MRLPTLRAHHARTKISAMIEARKPGGAKQNEIPRPPSVKLGIDAQEILGVATGMELASMERGEELQKQMKRDEAAMPPPPARPRAEARGAKSGGAA